MDKKFVRAGFGVMILRDDKVLLGRRHDDPEKADSELHGEGTWTMPGGKLEFGETFEEGTERELAEETGISCGTIKLISVANNIVPDAHFITLGFLAEGCTGEPKVMEPDEITTWDWFDLNNLPEKVFPPSKEVIEAYQSGEIYTSK